ncbi:MAG: helix-turn-helix transcriptional regulator [Deltaproteobacteria bacterium]|nr:helix-turn-helix transcriptional regulator [Deltaproteobacteria bacterium]
MKKKIIMADDKASLAKEMLDRLEALRKEKNLKEEYVAKQLGIERAAYIGKENGAIPISVKEWLRISDIMEVKLIYFLKDNA